MIRHDESGDDDIHDIWVLNVGDEPHTAPALGALQDVDEENTAE